MLVPKTDFLNYFVLTRHASWNLWNSLPSLHPPSLLFEIFQIIAQHFFFYTSQLAYFFASKFISMCCATFYFWSWTTRPINHNISPSVWLSVGLSHFIPFEKFRCEYFMDVNASAQLYTAPTQPSTTGLSYIQPCLKIHTSTLTSLKEGLSKCWNSHICIY